MKISYGDSQTQTLVFENEGDGILEFELARNVSDSGSKLLGNKKIQSLASSSCLTIEPIRGVIKAGEKLSVNVKLEISQREAQLMFLYKSLSETLTIDTNEAES